MQIPAEPAQSYDPNSESESESESDYRKAILNENGSDHDYVGEIMRVDLHGQFSL
jgi:hypothetical protein